MFQPIDTVFAKPPRRSFLAILREPVQRELLLPSGTSERWGQRRLAGEFPYARPDDDGGLFLAQ